MFAPCFPPLQGNPCFSANPSVLRPLCPPCARFGGPLSQTLFVSSSSAQPAGAEGCTLGCDVVGTVMRCLGWIVPSGYAPLLAVSDRSSQLTAVASPLLHGASTCLSLHTPDHPDPTPSCLNRSSPNPCQSCNLTRLTPSSPPPSTPCATPLPEPRLATSCHPPNPTSPPPHPSPHLPGVQHGARDRQRHGRPLQHATNRRLRCSHPDRQGEANIPGGI